jgi:hypothetical protein
MAIAAEMMTTTVMMAAAMMATAMMTTAMMTTFCEGGRRNEQASGDGRYQGEFT